VRGAESGYHRHVMGAAELWAGLAYAEAFFAGEASVQRAMRKLAVALAELGIPYALIGGMALNEYGYRRVTVDIDVVMMLEGLKQLKAGWSGHGYVEKFPGSRGFRDTEHDVTIDVLIAGEYPGDRKPKPVRFPDPAEVAIRKGALALVPLATLVELKLASGISTVSRLRDLGDVQELIKYAKLPRELVEDLDASVRERYLELWDAAQTPDPLQE
jgi:hypothetical protein